jgi:hypothetical protein
MIIIFGVIRKLAARCLGMLSQSMRRGTTIRLQRNELVFFVEFEG